MRHTSASETLFPYRSQGIYNEGNEALFSKSNVAIEARKGLRKTFDHICAKTDELILLNRFSVVDLKSYLEKSEGKMTEKTLKADDTFSYW